VYAHCRWRQALRRRTGAVATESRLPNGDAQPAARRGGECGAARRSARAGVKNRSERAVGCSRCWAATGVGVAGSEDERARGRRVRPIEGDTLPPPEMRERDVRGQHTIWLLAERHLPRGTSEQERQPVPRRFCYGVTIWSWSPGRANRRDASGDSSAVALPGETRLGNQ
jgi:hypothetical protein